MSEFDDSTSAMTSSSMQTLVETYIQEARLNSETFALKHLAQRLSQFGSTCWLGCCESLMHRNLPHQAAFLMDIARRKFPADMEVLYSLGAALRLTGDGATAETVLIKVLHTNAGHERACLALALLYRDRGQNSAAAALIIALHRRSGGVELTLYLVDLLRQCRREQQALELCEAELSRSPNHGKLQFTAGGLALTLGRFDQARSLLLAALDHEVPELGALMPLALTQRYVDPADTDISRFRHSANSVDLAPSIRSAAGFALAKAYDDLGDYAGAAAALRLANQLKHEQKKWSVAVWQKFVNEQLKKFSLPSIIAPITDEFVPVFVVGLPRTGTTLVAELLAQHSEVKSRGELPWIGFIAGNLAMSDATIDQEKLRRSALLYLGHLRQDDEKAHWYVDKNPMNFRYLLLIVSLFPNAKIIVCERDRRDTALSLWSQSFDSEETNFAHDFGDIEQLALGYDLLMEHWRNCLPNAIFSVNYEQLATSPRDIVNDMQLFIGMPVKDLIDARATNKTTINTASVWQARQPIYDTSIGRARAYTSLVPELLKFRSSHKEARDQL